MDRQFAKHAELAHLHVEIQHVDGKWAWSVLDTRDHMIVGWGRVHSLESAIEAAEGACGGKPSEWHTVSRPIELKTAL